MNSDLVGHLAWPITVLILAFMGRSEIRKIVASLGDRIGQKNTNVQIGKDGIKIEAQIEEYRSKVEGQEIDLEQIKALVLEIASKNEAVIKKSEPEEIDQELRKMADEYMAVNAQDWRDRVRMKDDLARRMASHVITKNISRDSLSDQHHEGLIMALAATIHSLPTAGDTDRLLRVAHESSRLHVQYRIVLAFGRLVERGMASSDDIGRIYEILDAYERGADKPLLRRITATRLTISQASK